MPTRRIAALALVLLACPRPSEPSAVPVVTPPVERVTEAPPVEPPAPAPATEPAPEQAVVPVETGFAKDAVIGWPTDRDNPNETAVVLFPDELAALRRAVAAALAKRKIAMIPIVELERIEDAAAAGKLVLEGDRTCASPLSRAEVHARYFAGHPQILIDSACFDGCRITVTVQRTPEDADYFTSPKVKHPVDPHSWTAAAARLSDELYGIGGFGLMGIGNPPPVRFGSPSSVGTWPKPPRYEQLSALDGRASACAHPDPLRGLTYELRAQVDRRGKVERCAAEGPAPWARATEQDCLCNVLGELRFGPASGPRRMRVQAIDDSGFAQGGTLALLQPGTEPWVERLRDSLALERCATQHVVPAGLDAVISLTLADSGKVDEVRIDAKLDNAAAMQWGRCVVGELGSLALPCRPPGIEVLRVRLTSTKP